jgi:predicted RNA-binding protein with PIN domain
MPAQPPPTADGTLPVGGERLLRDACRLALEVAAAGEAASPRIPAPAVLVPLFRHTRLSAASYAKVRACIDEDGVFRARVAEAATPETVGRAGWLWLDRPVGWAEDPAFLGDGTVAPGPRHSKGDRDGAARLRQKLAEAEAARKDAAAQASSARKEAAALRAERDALAEQVASLVGERREAMRTAKAHEADLARARADLKTRRQAMIDLEQELAQARAAAPAPASVPTPVAEEPGELAPGIDRSTLEASIGAAARAAADLSDALRVAAGALAPPVDPPGPATDPSGAMTSTAARSSKKTREKGPRRPSRPLPALAPGLFQGTPEADRMVLSQAANVVIVDGYNVARAAWDDLAPIEERRRTVRLLEGLQARSGGQIVVVFDGQDGEVAPQASRSIRVRFSSSGRTADDAIADLVEALPADQPVVVVSSDKAVARHASRHGALTMSSAALLAAVR